MTVATNEFLGGAPAIAGLTTWTFATAGSIGDIITTTIGSKAVTYTTTATALATFLPLFQAYLSSLSSTVFPEFNEMTWGSTATTITCTAKTAGKPCIVLIATNSATTTINGGASSLGTATIPSSGPNDPTTAANWSTGAIPQSTLATPVMSAPAASIASGSLSNGTTYYWVLSAVNLNGETVKSNQVTLTMSSPNLTATLAWTAVPNATGYRIYRTTSTGVYTPTALLVALGSGTLTYNDTGAVALTTGATITPSTALGDNVVVDREGTALLYNLNQSSIILSSRRMTAQNLVIGLPKTNTDGTAYPEFRPDSWQIGAVSDYLNTKSGRIKLDQGATAVTYEQDNSGSGLESSSGIPAVLLKGTNAANVWNIFGGNAGFGWFSGELPVVFVLNQQSGTTVALGQGSVVGTVNNFGGKLLCYAPIVTALNHPGAGGGTSTIEGSGAVGQITMQSGTCNYNTTGALGGNTVLSDSSRLIFDGDQRTKTVTNPISVYSNSVTVSDKFGVISGGYTVKAVNCNWQPSTTKPNSQFVISSL